MLIAECNCHDHADSCFFNPYVYAATGNVSGGVCDNCTHNTEGRQCEFCKLGFYQDPALELNHPEICKREFPFMSSTKNLKAKYVQQQQQNQHWMREEQQQ